MRTALQHRVEAATPTKGQGKEAESCRPEDAAIFVRSNEDLQEYE